MPLALLIAACAAVLVTGLLAFRGRHRRNQRDVAHDTTPALERWIEDTLEHELAEGALGMRSSTPEERKRLAATLRGEPDADVVSRLEDAVRTIELEFVRYAHEGDAEVTLHVRYEDGRDAKGNRRLPWSDVPEAVRADFERRSATRVFRTWTFPWSRVRAL